LELRFCEPPLNWAIKKKKRGENQNIIPNIETDCLNFDFFFFDFYDYSDTRLEFIKWKPIWEKTMRYASAKRRVKSNLFSNNLPDQNEDVNYNPKNPDSRQYAINIV
jgi:hypothetical protein